MEETSLTLEKVTLSARDRWSHSPEGWLFLLIGVGRGVYSTQSFPQSVATGDVLVVRAGLGGALLPDKGTELTAFYFRFFPEYFTTLFSLDEWRRLEATSDQTKRAKFFPAKSDLARRFQSIVVIGPNPVSLSYRCQLLQLIAASLAEDGTPVIREAASDNALGALKSDIGLPIILKQISSDELLKLSVEELSTRCGYSRRHLNRIFREHFGQSVMGVKIKLRLDKAANLLRNPKAKVINVALECGFSHLGMFSSRFKRHFGLTPAQWREEQYRHSEPPEPFEVISPQPIKPRNGNGNGKPKRTIHRKD